MKIDGLCDDDSFYKLAKELADIPSLTYEEFVEHGEVCPTAMKKYFTSELFANLARNNKGAIGSEDFLRFIQRSMDLEATICGLLMHAIGKETSPLGFITEKELELYILLRLIPEIPSCRSLHQSFHPYYVFTAARRFFFFLDPKKSKRISITKLAHSTQMEELMFLKRISEFEKDMEPTAFATQVCIQPATASYNFFFLINTKLFHYI